MERISDWNKLYRISAMSALLQLAVVVVYFIIMAMLGGKPDSVEEYLMIPQSNRLIGFLQGDIFYLRSLPCIWGFSLGFTWRSGG